VVLVVLGLGGLGAGGYFVARAVRGDESTPKTVPPEVAQAFTNSVRAALTPADLAGRPADVPAGVPKRGRIEMLVPAADGGAAWGTMTWREPARGICWRTARETDLVAMKLSLPGNCRGAHEKRAVNWEVTRITDTLTDAQLADLHARHAVLPGATLVAGVLSPKVRSVSVRAPGFAARILTISKRRHVFTTLFTAVLEKGRIVVRVTLRDGSKASESQVMTAIHA
jgi:hypothetical protein